MMCWRRLSSYTADTFGTSPPKETGQSVFVNLHHFVRVDKRTDQSVCFQRPSRLPRFSIGSGWPIAGSSRWDVGQGFMPCRGVVGCGTLAACLGAGEGVAV